MAAIEKAKRDYEELKQQLQPEMASVESELVGLTAVQDPAKQTLSPAANVDAVATAELPTMNSGDSIAEPRNVELTF